MPRGDLYAAINSKPQGTTGEMLAGEILVRLDHDISFQVYLSFVRQHLAHRMLVTHHLSRFFCNLPDTGTPHMNRNICTSLYLDL